ncbi:unnamed protein product, partial [Rotaria socialis]
MTQMIIPVAQITISMAQMANSYGTNDHWN